MGLNIKNICNQSQIKQINNWMEDFQKGITKPLFIYGNSGSGKTTLSHLIFSKYNYAIIDYTKLYINNHKNIIESLDTILNMKSITMMFEKSIVYKGLIIDDLDNYIDHDKYIFTAVENVIKNIKNYPKNPLIIIACKLSKKHLLQFKNQCNCINLKQTYNKIKEITKEYLFINKIILNDDEVDTFIKSCGNNIITINEKIKFLKHTPLSICQKPVKLSICQEPVKLSNKDLVNNNLLLFNNDILLYINYLFNIEFDKNTITDIYINIYSDINVIILSILENAVKYLHNSKLKYYKDSIINICLLYDNIVLSDYFDYINVQNHNYDINYIILHGIIYPSYYIYINNLTNRKSQYNYKETTIYSKSIIEIYNNKKKVSLESISYKINNIDNFIKIYYNSLISNDDKIILWCENVIQNETELKDNLIKYIKYIFSKCFNYKLKIKKSKKNK